MHRESKISVGMKTWACRKYIYFLIYYNQGKSNSKHPCCQARGKFSQTSLARCGIKKTMAETNIHPIVPIDVILIDEAHCGSLRYSGPLFPCHIQSPRISAEAGTPGAWSPTSLGLLHGYPYWATATFQSAAVKPNVGLWWRWNIFISGNVSLLSPFSVENSRYDLVFFSLVPPKGERHWLPAASTFHTAKIFWSLISRLTKGLATRFKGRRKMKRGKH